MKHALQTALCLLFTAIVFSGCDENRLEVDVSNQNVSVELERADSLWPKMTPVSFRASHPRLLDEYPEVYKHYIEDVLKLGKVSDSNLFALIREFVTHHDIAEVYDDVNTEFGSMDDVNDELTLAWKHYQYYFPDRTIPRHLTCVGGFNTPFIMTENGVGICLELFLGSDSKFYDYLQWPVYQRTRMTKKHLVPWLMKGWLETDYPQIAEQSTLLDDIIHQGKIYYCLDAMLPNTPDSIKIGYTSSEGQWAADHEKMVWAHFVDNELLFTTEPGQKSKFTNDGPFTVDLVKESPSRMGHYIGWKIVRNYISQQDNIDLNKLMKTEAQVILNQSKYKP